MHLASFEICLGSQIQALGPSMKGEVLMKEELSKEEEELAEMVAINDDDIYPLAGKRSIWGEDVSIFTQSFRFFVHVF